MLLGAGLPGAPIRLAAAAVTVPESATLLAPGPAEGEAARLAAQAAVALARGLVQAAALRVSVLGGPDGITAANRFASASFRDGPMLLLLPGPAAQAQLVGETRARFEPRHWPAVCGSVQPSLLAGRGPLSATRPVRLALPAAAAAEAGALLALDLLGRPAVPVFGLNGLAAQAAMREGSADALVLSGPACEARARALGLTPWFAFDAVGQPRDPALPGLPALSEVVTDPARPDLLLAAEAAGAALRTRAVLVLPALTSGDVVALWRGAARTWAEDAADAADAGSRRIGADAATVLLTTLCPAPEVALAYRVWLLRRLNFQAG
ncbi:hypothetical protein [Falsiroseomonas selenitidurans]|uniref:Uncharacterized protein n=1 Tax=Falsiroseomonas selenitidurans TaxID=2716335 RepID=A0ABX1EAF7_9PROT|nr:hypothetical protein [Falsiroseomonas selenitidurans]NKC34204.1 hypothetical protein [Falsiroseomonas selenitidurans]